VILVILDFDVNIEKAKIRRLVKKGTLYISTYIYIVMTSIYTAYEKSSEKD